MSSKRAPVIGLLTVAAAVATPFWRARGRSGESYDREAVQRRAISAQARFIVSSAASSSRLAVPVFAIAR
jgi:hypothetical protein